MIEVGRVIRKRICKKIILKFPRNILRALKAKEQILR